MLEQEVVDYISQAQKHGLSDFEIKQNLLNAGWEAAVVEDSLVFAKAAETKTVLTPEMAKTVNISSLPDEPPHQPPVSQIPPQTASPVEPTHPPLALNNQPSESNSKPVYKKPLLWAIIIVLILGAGSAYAYINFFSATPTKVMGKYLSAPKPKTFNTIYSFSYTDSSTASSTGSIGVNFNGNLSTDLSGLNDIKQQNNINASITYGVANIGFNFKYLLIGQVIYFDIGQIPQLKAFLPDQNIEWIKIDLNELKQQQGQSGSQVFNQLFLSNQLQDQLKSIWSQTNVLKTTNFLAKENLNGIPTYHLKEQFDNQAFAAAFTNTLQAIAGSSTSTNAGLSGSDKQLINALINKVQVKELDLWIGQKDSELYKFHLVVSAPSVKDFSNPSLVNDSPVLSQAKSKERNAKRVTDVQQISTSLQLYNNDFGGYPPAGSNGQPQGIVPTYIAVWPAAPLPLDGTCTNYYNTYWYTPQGKAFVKNGVTLYPSYKLTFCLGALTGGFNGGIGQLTPGGIQADISCPTTPEKCVNISAPPDNSAAILDAVNKMAFGAQIQIDASYSGYGQPQNITAPAASTDILDLMKGSNQQSQYSTTTPALQN